MFRIPIWGDLDGKTVKIFLGSRYKIKTDVEIFEGTLAECTDSQFLIKTTEGGYWIDFEKVEDIIPLQ